MGGGRKDLKPGGTPDRADVEAAGRWSVRLCLVSDLGAPGLRRSKTLWSWRWSCGEGSVPGSSRGAFLLGKKPQSEPPRRARIPGRSRLASLKKRLSLQR